MKTENQITLTLSFSNDRELLEFARAYLLWRTGKVPAAPPSHSPENPYYEIRQQLESFEGRKNVVYVDTNGFPTVGIGHRTVFIDAELVGRALNVGDQITDEEVLTLFVHDVDSVQSLLEKTAGFSSLSEGRKNALIDLAFSMGYSGLKKFENMWAAIERGDFKEAAKEIVNSKWAKDVGERRSSIVARMMEEGITFTHATGAK